MSTRFIEPFTCSRRRGRKHMMRFVRRVKPGWAVMRCGACGYTFNWGDE